MKARNSKLKGGEGLLCKLKADHFFSSTAFRWFTIALHVYGEFITAGLELDKGPPFKPRKKLILKGCF